MQKLLKLEVLITIVLLNCSISWSQNSQYFSTGEQVEDSVLVPYSALKEANAKMIELKYQKTINEALNNIIDNDRKIMAQMSSDYYVLKKENNVVKRERNIFIGSSVIFAAVILLLL